jgi:hypothetical protein
MKQKNNPQKEEDLRIMRYKLELNDQRLKRLKEETLLRDKSKLKLTQDSKRTTNGATRPYNAAK